jgi:hypothetical protein
MRFAVEDLRPGMTATDVRHRYVLGVAQGGDGESPLPGLL